MALFPKQYRMVLKTFAWIFLVGCTVPSRAESPVNQLTRSEALAGWQLLFDGTSAKGWRNYQKQDLSEGWQIVDGALIRAGKNAGDIVSDAKYRYFEFSIEYQISKAGNSGFMFHVTEDNPAPWQSGPEIQIQDNVDGHDPQKSGWLYQLAKPYPMAWAGETQTPDATRPAGQWNQLFVRIAPNQCEVSMNGVVYYQFKLGDGKWNEQVSKSKFAEFAGFGKAGEGHLCLQDHGDEVKFRNIKIRELAEDGSTVQPIDGKLNLSPVLAFPKLEWDGWQPVDEDGNPNTPRRILELTHAPGQPNLLYAMDQSGVIYSLENRSDVTKSKLFFDIQAKVNRWNEGMGANEQGLLGLAFHPNYPKNGQFFVCYTKKENNHSIVARYERSKKDSSVADIASEQIIMDIEQPYTNHNGGCIEFGKDGYLYISLGDGGGRNDPKNSGQDRSDLLGSILRIDVNATSDGLPYSIPADNPFVGQPGVRPEIYAYGLRNPWRIAFDSKSGRLWCADVGQDLWEEINIISKGGNYGWSIREGSYSFGNRARMDGVSDPIGPVWAYDHSAGKSITGGRVVNSNRVPALNGKYLYADYVSGSIWALSYDPATNSASRNEQVVEKGIPVMAFGEDSNGDVYYMIDSAKGQCIYKFE